VSDLLYDQSKVTKYREAAIELHKLSLSVEQRLASAFENGKQQDARDALAELRASSAEFQKLRSTLTPTDLFIAKYNIQVHGAHEVSFVLPQGVSRYEMLCEAQGLVIEQHLIYPGQLKDWSNDERFKASTTVPERIQIDGHVEGGDRMNRADQEAFLTRKKLPLATLEDLAAAFVAHYVATGTDLFEGKWVRAAGGALYFGSYGLSVYDIGNVYSNRNVAVSARVPRNLKN
jgi:hypothetical protein